MAKAKYSSDSLRDTVLNAARARLARKNRSYRIPTGEIDRDGRVARVERAWDTKSGFSMRLTGGKIARVAVEIV